MDKPRCSKTIFTGERWDFRGHGCTLLGKVRIDGKWFCKIHDPKEEKKRDSAKRERWNQESNAREAKWKADADREAKRDKCEADRAALIACLRGLLELTQSEIKPPRPTGEWVEMTKARVLLARLDTP